MTDVATIGILQERAIHDSRAFSTQLEGALESRIVIEQAKGIVAEHEGISVDDAFARLRTFPVTTTNCSPRPVVESSTGRFDPTHSLAPHNSITRHRPAPERRPHRPVSAMAIRRVHGRQVRGTRRVVSVHASSVRLTM
jgi:ANTAR domain